MDEIERELKQVVSGLAGKPIKKEVKEVIKEKPVSRESLNSEIDAMLKGAIGEIGREPKKKKPDLSPKELIDMIPELRARKAEPAARPGPSTKPASQARPAPPVIPNIWPEEEARIPVAKEIRARVPAPEKSVNNIPSAPSRVPFGSGRAAFGIDRTMIEVDKIPFDLPKAPPEPERVIIEPEKAPEKEKKVYFEEYAEPQKKKASFAVIGGLVALIVVAGSVAFFILKSKKSGEPSPQMLSSIQPSLPAEFTSRQEEVKAPPVSTEPESKPVLRKPAAQTEDQTPSEFIAPVQLPLTLPSEAGTLGLQEQSAQKKENPSQKIETSTPISTETVTPPLSSQPQKEQQAGSPAAVQSGVLVSLEQVDVQPALVKKIEPRYPPLALNMGLSGTVTVNTLISETGDVVRTEILKGIKGGYGFERAAEAAIKQWKFRPARKDGVNVKVWKPIDITFRLTELPTKE
jgi:protein TonB